MPTESRHFYRELQNIIQNKHELSQEEYIFKLKKLKLKVNKSLTCEIVFKNQQSKLMFNVYEILNGNN